MQTICHDPTPYIPYFNTQKNPLTKKKKDKKLVPYSKVPSWLWIKHEFLTSKYRIILPYQSFFPIHTIANQYFMQQCTHCNTNIS